MVTEKLFYQDAYQQSFHAEVIKSGADHEKGPFVVLDRTAFYPEGGGQPADQGKLDGREVLDVQTVDGEIRHYLRAGEDVPKGKVFGEIDWERRFDHMQQHMGQHILSAAFEELFDIPTTSFHLGEDTVTIDLNIEALSEEQMVAAEAKANEIILDNRPVETKWMTVEEASRYPLRKALAVTGDVRLVIIPNWDYNGCGGTHPSRTGEVMAVKLLKWERQRKQARLEFVCGHRVLKQLHDKQAVLKKLAQLLNSPQAKMSEAAERLLQERKDLQAELEDREERLLEYEAGALWQKHSNEQAVIEVFQGRSIQSLQKLARLIVSKEKHAIVLLIAEGEDKLQMVAAAGAVTTINLKEYASLIFPLIEGKGGGNPHFIQGGGRRIVTSKELANAFLKKIASDIKNS